MIGNVIEVFHLKPYQFNKVTAISMAVAWVPLFAIGWVMFCALSECKFRKLGMDTADGVMENLKNGNKVAGGGTMDETDTIPTFTNKSNPEDVPFLMEKAGGEINISQSQSTLRE